MVIPRRVKMEFDYMFDFQWQRRLTGWDSVNDGVQLVVSPLCFMIIMIPITIDAIIWIIIIIIVGAGNMIAGGIYEAHPDYRVVKYVTDMEETMDEDELSLKRELLVTVACGDLTLDKGAPLQATPRNIVISGPDSPTNRNEKARSRLLNLLGAQMSFGETVGNPVLFYIGAFCYKIMDLRHDSSSGDSAISLAFGIKRMVVVHGAIVSGCLLASNNPSTAAGIVGPCHEALSYRPFIFRRVRALERQQDPKGTSRCERKHFYHLYLS
ncbi:hypothetical protein BDZ45DRAFT_88641 [Acephala macrosclerotiorum]|nr:hypothetical protein BDZ45DRAFT_88641 [Acephala macrosclerotiorum]